MKEQITVEITVNRPLNQVWEKWTLPEHIRQWNSATDDWHTPEAVNDLRPGGHFSYRMAARDGSASFDFAGTYDDVVPSKRIGYTLGDGRKVVIEFAEADGHVTVTETFEAETVYPLEMQRSGWQAILLHFKSYTESE